MLLLGVRDLKALIDAAEAAYPEEACALLVGRRGPGDRIFVERIVQSRNVAEDRRRRFEVDPGLRIGLERELRGGPLAVVGVWHSHPDGPARLSATDLASAYEPELAWLLTMVAGGQALHSAAYLLNDWGDGFRPLDLIILQGN
ncbi:MAG: M67 family metallopeptidase [Alphaproteobacteria bacterium]|nr:M67 family metallopeptidase [Alphaproteobacteria bacterium]